MMPQRHAYVRTTNFKPSMKIHTRKQQFRAGHYHSRVEQSIGHRLHVVPIDPVVPDLHLRGLANLAAREHAEPDALSEIKSNKP